MNRMGRCCEKTLGFLFYVIRVLLPPRRGRGGAAAGRGGEGILRDAELSFYNTYLKPLYLYILALKNEKGLHI